MQVYSPNKHTHRRTRSLKLVVLIRLAGEQKYFLCTFFVGEKGREIDDDEYRPIRDGRQTKPTKSISREAGAGSLHSVHGASAAPFTLRINSFQAGIIPIRYTHSIRFTLGEAVM